MKRLKAIHVNDLFINRQYNNNNSFPFGAIVHQAFRKLREVTGLYIIQIKFALAIRTSAEQK